MMSNRKNSSIWGGGKGIEDILVGEEISQRARQPRNRGSISGG